MTIKKNPSLCWNCGATKEEHNVWLHQSGHVPAIYKYKECIIFKGSKLAKRMGWE
jgi:hypothetical protein